MDRIYLIAYIILMFAFGYWASEFRQEQARVKVANPKYIKDVAVFTGRKSRHDPYLTNMTGTILMPFGNNVSVDFYGEEQARNSTDTLFNKVLQSLGCIIIVASFYENNVGKELTKSFRETKTQAMAVDRQIAFIHEHEVEKKAFAITLTMRAGGDFRIVAKVCDTVKSKWMNEFMSQFTNISLNHCPFPAGKYMYINMELPPKNIPIPIADGDYFIKYELFVTATKETIVQVDTLLHFEQNARKDKGKKKKG